MSRALVYPWIYVTQLVGWLVLFGSFFFAISFMMATPIAELDLGGKSLPSDWEAAYKDHGAYLKAYLLYKHPFLFALSVAVLISAVLAQSRVRRELARQILEGGEPRARADKIVRNTSVLIGFVLTLLAFKFLVVRAYPA
jgi:hypothetical protein